MGRCGDIVVGEVIEVGPDSTQSPPIYAALREECADVEPPEHQVLFEQPDQERGSDVGRPLSDDRIPQPPGTARTTGFRGNPLRPLGVQVAFRPSHRHPRGP